MRQNVKIDDQMAGTTHKKTREPILSQKIKSAKKVNGRAETQLQKDKKPPCLRPIENESASMANERAETPHHRDKKSSRFRPIEIESTGMMNKRTNTSHHRDRGSQSPSLIHADSKRMMNHKADGSCHTSRESSDRNLTDDEYTRMMSKRANDSNHRTIESPRLSSTKHDSTVMGDKSRFQPIENRNYSPHDDTKCFWKISTRPPSSTNQPKMILSHSSCETDFIIPQPIKARIVLSQRHLVLASLL